VLCWRLTQTLSATGKSSLWVEIEKPMRRFTFFIVPILAGVAAGFWLPHARWDDIDEGLLAFLGLIAAGLLQMIPATISFVQPEHVTPIQARAFSRDLEKLQRYWLGMLVFVLLTAVILIISRLFVGHSSVDMPYFEKVDFSQVLSGLGGFCFVLVIERALHIVPIVNTLQKRRTAIVIEAASRRTKAELEAQQAPLPNVTPEGYGEIVSRH